MSRYIIILLFNISLMFNINAQQKSIDIQQRIDSVLILKPETYKGINDIMRPFRRDSTKLQYLITVFDNNNYLVGKSYAQNLLGILYRNYSEYKNAIVIHKQALETATQANSIEFRIFSLNMLGVD